jgi:hypothetical protein
MNKTQMILLTVCALILIKHQVLANDDREITILRYVYVVGKAHALDVDHDVRERLAPYRATLNVSSKTETEIRDVPRECGIKVLDLFLDQVQERFLSGGVESCGSKKQTTIGHLEISCATTYIQGYDRVFFYLEYKHISDSHVKVILETKQRTQAGSVYPASQLLTKPDQSWLRSLYKSIKESAACK